jgi:hypothetical protein
MNASLRTRGWLLLLAIVPVAALAGAATPVQSSSAAECTIAGMMKTPGVEFALASSGPSLNATKAATAASAAVTTFEAAYPAGDVRDATVSSVSAPGVPDIDGHTASMVLFSDPTVVPAGLPVGSEPELYTVGCAIAFYDAQTGQYLATVKRLDPVTP